MYWLVLRHVVVDYLCIWTPYLDLLILDLQNLTSNFKGRNGEFDPISDPPEIPDLGCFGPRKSRVSDLPNTSDTLRHGDRDVE